MANRYCTLSVVSSKRHAIYCGEMRTVFCPALFSPFFLFSISWLGTRLRRHSFQGCIYTNGMYDTCAPALFVSPRSYVWTWTYMPGLASNTHPRIVWFRINSGEVMRRPQSTHAHILRVFFSCRDGQADGRVCTCTKFANEHLPVEDSPFWRERLDHDP